MKKNLLITFLIISIFACNKKSTAPDYAAVFVGTYSNETIEKISNNENSLNITLGTIKKVGVNTLEFTLTTRYVNKKTNGEITGDGAYTTTFSKIKVKDFENLEIDEYLKSPVPPFDPINVKGSAQLKNSKLYLYYAGSAKTIILDKN